MRNSAYTTCMFSVPSRSTPDDMFCDKCEAFWKTVINNANIPANITSSSDIHWAPHETVLHTCMRELKHSSDLKCILCRCIFASPTEFELPELLRDENAKLNVVVEFDTDRRPKPVLSVTFIEPDEKGLEDAVRIPKRMLAVCSGVLTDGESYFVAKLRRLLQFI